MASKIKCPHCSARLKLPDGFSRTQAECPQCKKVIPIPTEPWSPPPLPPALSKTNLKKTSKPLVNISEKSIPEQSQGLQQSSPIELFRLLILKIVSYSIIGAIVFALIGVALSQYCPIFGGWEKFGMPWSPARRSLILLHVFILGITGLFLGALSGAVSSVLTKSDSNNALKNKKPRSSSTSAEIAYEAGKKRRQKFRLGFGLLFLLLIPFSIYVLYNTLSGNLGVPQGKLTVFRRNPGFSVSVYGGGTEGSAYVITNLENEPLQVNGVKLNGEYDCQLGRIDLSGVKESQLRWPVKLSIGETAYAVQKPSYLSRYADNQNGIAWKEYNRSVIYLDVFTTQGEFHFDGRGHPTK